MIFFLSISSHLLLLNLFLMAIEKIYKCRVNRLLIFQIDVHSYCHIP